MVVGRNHITDKLTTVVTLPNEKTAEVSWYQFKIPVRDPESKVGGVNMKSIRFVRMYLTQFEKETDKNEIINKRKEIIREKTGMSFDPSLRTYPIQIDETEIERVTLEQSSKKENDIFTLNVIYRGLFIPLRLEML